MHSRLLERQNAIYSYTTNQIKTFTIAATSTSVIFENIFPSNRLPGKICIGLTNSDGFQSKINKNPYNFEHFNCSNVSISVDNLTLEYRNLSLNYPNTCLLAFQTLVNGLNLEQQSIGISRKNYSDGNVLLCVDRKC